MIPTGRVSFPTAESRFPAGGASRILGTASLAIGDATLVGGRAPRLVGKAACILCNESLLVGRVSFSSAEPRCSFTLRHFSLTAPRFSLATPRFGWTSRRSRCDVPRFSLAERPFLLSANRSLKPKPRRVQSMPLRRKAKALFVEPKPCRRTESARSLNDTVRSERNLSPPISLNGNGAISSDGKRRFFVNLGLRDRSHVDARARTQQHHVREFREVRRARQRSRCSRPGASVSAREGSR